MYLYIVYIHSNSCIWRCNTNYQRHMKYKHCGSSFQCETSKIQNDQFNIQWITRDTNTALYKNTNTVRVGFQHGGGPNTQIQIQKYKHDASGFSAWWWPSRVHAGPSGGRGGCSIMLHLPHLLSTTNTNIQVYKYTDANKKYSVGRYYAQDTNRLRCLTSWPLFCMVLYTQIHTVVYTKGYNAQNTQNTNTLYYAACMLATSILATIMLRPAQRDPAVGASIYHRLPLPQISLDLVGHNIPNIQNI